LANTVSVDAPGSEPSHHQPRRRHQPNRCGQRQPTLKSIRQPAEPINNNNRVAQAGTAIALALGGTANLQPGRRFAVAAGFGNFQGGNALDVGLTGRLYETKSYAVVANAGVGFSVDTNVVGSRGVVSLQW